MNIKYIPGNRAGMMMDPLKEGIIEIRPGVRGLSLGDKKYVMAYIRVLDEDHYFKGMCIYSNDLPDHYDVICYYRDPSNALKTLRHVKPEIKLNKGIMTKVKDDGKWDKFSLKVAESFEK